MQTLTCYIVPHKRKVTKRTTKHWDIKLLGDCVKGLHRATSCSDFTTDPCSDIICVRILMFAGWMRKDVRKDGRRREVTVAKSVVLCMIEALGSFLGSVR